MQICTLTKPEQIKQEETAPRSLFERYADLAEKHKNVAIMQIDNQDFIVKSLGRRDYREIMLSQELDKFLKEEAICEICCLYPENFDFENCDAGIPSKLYEDIIKFSFLDNAQEQERSNLMNYFRTEMIELHNQINCMIAEAFPSLEFDAIENFDMPTALKYLSRAEWILQNFRGFEMSHDPFTGNEWEPDQLTPQEENYMDEPQEPIKQKPQQQPKQEPKQPKVVPPGFEAGNSFIPGETIEERIERLKKGEIKKEKLTSQKLSQLEQQFPEIDWRQQLEEQDFNSNVDTTPMALRTPDQIYKKY